MRAPLDPGWCNGTVIVHDDRTFTCTDLACAVQAPTAVVVSVHARFLSCHHAFCDATCPHCRT
jgi:hypothetical protein